MVLCKHFLKKHWARKQCLSHPSLTHCAIAMNCVLLTCCHDQGGTLNEWMNEWCYFSLPLSFSSCHLPSFHIWVRSKKNRDVGINNTNKISPAQWASAGQHRLQHVPVATHHGSLKARVPPAPRGPHWALAAERHRLNSLRHWTPAAVHSVGTWCCLTKDLQAPAASVESDHFSSIKITLHLLSC